MPHGGADVDSGPLALHHTIGPAANQAAAGNHTHGSTAHTHVESDVTGLTSDLADKAALGHSHSESDVTSLTSDLAGKAALVHTHTQSQSHNSADTDSASTSLHHTIGSSATQAAAGDHSHGFPRFVGSILPTDATSTLTLTANRAYYYRFVAPRTNTYNQMLVYVSTSLGGVDVGIYENSALQTPGARIASSGERSCPFAGSVQGINLSTFPTLDAGTTYWLAIASSSTPTFAASAAVLGSSILSTMGVAREQASAYPLPDTASSVAPTSTKVILIGYTV